MLKYRSLFAIVSVLVVACVCWAKDTQLIPREVFFGNPDKAGVQISPDGKHISYLAPHNDVLNVWIQTIGKDDARVITKADKRPIRIAFWAHNSEQIVYVQDKNGDENFHVYAVDIKSGKEIDLTPYENVQARIAETDKNFPNHILVYLNNRTPEFHDVWKINTRTGKGELVFQNDKGYVSVTADADFNIRLASLMNPQTGGLEVFARDPGKEDWYELASWDLEDTMSSEVAGISRDGRTVYLTDSRNVNTGRLYAYTFGQGGSEPDYKLIAHDDRVDVSYVVVDPDTGHPQAVAFEYTRREWKILDSSIKADWDYLKTLTDGELLITSRDRADEKWTVAYIRDDGPVAYYLYDRNSRSADFLFTNRSKLENLNLAKMKPVVIKSRDGLNLVSYLTLPLGSAGKHLPMVLLVHGGPWGRDNWGYDPLHQWLANRGYAVLSVNFRGSTGFGKDFVNAGDREWAGKMHDDLIDAVNWAVSEKIADPDRVAIMGGSYGGYATLVGLTFTPDFFAAGVDIVGPSHIKTLLESIPPYWSPIKVMFEKRIASLDETEYLDQISPLTRVDEIKKPLLIGQGKNDPRVKEAESKQIVAAMQEKNLPVTYVVFPDEGHGFARPVNNLAFFAATEVFLAEHLGGNYEPISDEIAKSSAIVEAGGELIPGLN